MFRYFQIRARYVGICVAVTAGIALACGCVTVKKRPALVVGNATEFNLTDVTVESGSDIYIFSDVEALKVSKPHVRRGTLAAQLKLKWTVDGSGSMTKSVALPEPVRNYSGHIQLEVGTAGSVKVFTAPVQDNGDSVLPWSMPANWEGSPTVPGMNM